MVRVELKNFQSIADEVIEIDGFTAVTGRSNIGKSAIVRAIKAAITGAPVDCYVRHSDGCPRRSKGAKSCKCFCSVRIVGDGLDLLWEKGDSVNRYVYNGVEHTAVARGTPEFLGQEFGLINLGPKERTSLQVSDQFHPLFILDKSGGVVADVLSDVAKLDQINVAIRLAEKDRKEAAGTRKVRERDISDIKLSLTKYAALDEALAKSNAVAELGRRVTETEAAAAALGKYYDALTLVARAIKALSGVAGVAIPPTQAMTSHHAQVTVLERLDNGFKEKTVALNALSGVDEVLIPVAEDVTRLSGQYQILDRLDKDLKDKTPAFKKLNGVTATQVPPIDVFGGLSSTFRKLTRWVSQIQTLKVYFAKMERAGGAEIPAPDFQKARDEFARLSQWARRLPVLSATLGQLKLDLTAAESDEAAVLAEFSALGVCPTCRQDMKAPALNHEVHSHA